MVEEVFCSQALYRDPCAVCDPGASDPQSFNGLTGTVLGVAMEVLQAAKATGTFSVGSIEVFWKRFGKHLCSRCQARLKGLDHLKAQAKAKLEEAVRLDRGNRAAADNLAAIKKMV